MSAKIAIIGAGNVGATAAYALTIKNIAAEVMLIDVNERKEAGEVMDIADTLSVVNTGQVKRGDFKDAKDADIIVITAGVGQKPGDTRLDLLEKNIRILKSIITSIGKFKASAIVLIVSNPIDVLTYVAQELIPLPKNQIFGTGTTLDTARLKTQIGQYLHVSPKNVHGYVLGEHGDSEFVAWSTVSVGGIQAANIKKLSSKKKKLIEEKVRKKAYAILERKGATYYGIGLIVHDVIAAILYDQQRILPVTARLSRWNGVHNVCLGAPAIIGKNGVTKHWPIPLNAAEKKQLKQSAKLIKSYIKQVI